MSNDIINATLVFDKEKEAIQIQSNGSNISEEYLKKEFQEDVSQGSIPDLLKNIISIQEKTNIVLTEFVNQEKAAAALTNNNNNKDKKRNSEKEINKLDKRNDKESKIDTTITTTNN